MKNYENTQKIKKRKNVCKSRLFVRLVIRQKKTFFLYIITFSYTIDYQVNTKDILNNILDHIRNYMLIILRLSFIRENYNILTNHFQVNSICMILEH